MLKNKLFRVIAAVVVLHVAYRALASIVTDVVVPFAKFLWDGGLFAYYQRNREAVWTALAKVAATITNRRYMLYLCAVYVVGCILAKTVVLLKKTDFSRMAFFLCQIPLARYLYIGTQSKAFITLGEHRHPHILMRVAAVLFPRNVYKLSPNVILWHSYIDPRRVDTHPSREFRSLTDVFEGGLSASPDRVAEWIVETFDKCKYEPRSHADMMAGGGFDGNNIITQFRHRSTTLVQLQFSEAKLRKLNRISRESSEDLIAALIIFHEHYAHIDAVNAYYSMRNKKQCCRAWPAASRGSSPRRKITICGITISRAKDPDGYIRNNEYRISNNEMFDSSPPPLPRAKKDVTYWESPVHDDTPPKDDTPPGPRDAPPVLIYANFPSMDVSHVQTALSNKEVETPNPRREEEWSRCIDVYDESLCFGTTEEQIAKKATNDGFIISNMGSVSKYSS